MSKGPSKKIIAFAIIAIGLVGSVVGSRYSKSHPEEFAKYFGWLNRNKVAKEETQAVVLETSQVNKRISSIEDKDADEDGLKDWEEMLWRTDPDKKDTDGDGTIDGTEIKDGRDPTKRGPDDNLSDKITGGFEFGENEGQSASTTATDVFSQTLFSKFLSLKSGESLDATSKEALVNDLTAKAQASFSYKQYPRLGFTVFPSDDKEKIRTYASNFGTLHLNFLVKLQQNASKAKTEPVFLANLYKEEAKALYELETPQAVSTEHLAIVNSLSATGSSLEAMVKYQNDPLTAMAALGTYKKVSEEELINFKKIAEYIRKNDIIFTEEESGSFWDNF